MLNEIWKKYRVLRRKDISNPAEIRCAGQGGGCHWWDYDKKTIDMLIDRCARNWKRWFRGYRKVRLNLLPYQIMELAIDSRVATQAKRWLTKDELIKLKTEARRITHQTSYYRKSLA